MLWLRVTRSASIWFEKELCGVPLKCAAKDAVHMSTTASATAVRRLIECVEELRRKLLPVTIDPGGRPLLTVSRERGLSAAARV